MKLGEACAFLEFPEHVRDTVVAAYSQPARTYHNVGHIEAMLSEASEYKPLIEAVVWHDYVYLFGGATGQSEAASVQAFLALRNHLDMKYKAEVCTAILATSFHTLDQPFPQDDPLVRELLDLDLQAFAWPWEEFVASTKRVWGESKQDIEVLREKTLSFYLTLSKRDQIYYIRDDWEQPARRNIHRMSALLESGEPI